MIEQTYQRFAARFAELRLGQLFGGLPVDRLDCFTQRRVVQGRLGCLGFVQEPLAVEVVQLANAMQPCDSPIDKLRPTLADGDEVATHMGPTERQLHHARLDLGHRLVGRVAIDHEDALGLLRIVSFGHVVRACRLKPKGGRVFAQETPKPPEVADLAFLLDEYRPTGLIRLPIERPGVAG